LADFSVIKEAGKLQVLLAAGNELNLIDPKRHLLLRALEKTSRNQMKAASVLGISHKRLRTETKNHGFLRE
jgi:DNA-binding protein Fis